MSTQVGSLGKLPILQWGHFSNELSASAEPESVMSTETTLHFCAASLGSRLVWCSAKTFVQQREAVESQSARARNIISGHRAAQAQ